HRSRSAGRPGRGQRHQRHAQPRGGPRRRGRGGGARRGRRAGDRVAAPAGGPSVGRLAHGARLIRVAVVADPSLIRVGLRTLFDTEDDIELVAEAEDGRAAVRMVRAERPDVVLMDIRMPQYDGLAALHDITADPDLANVRVVMLTTFELDEYVFE